MTEAEFGGKPDESLTLRSRLSAVAGRLASSEAAQLETNSHQPIFEMAREQVLKTYAETYADKRQEQWLLLGNLIKETPLMAAEYHPGNQGFYASRHHQMPSHYAFAYESLSSQRGVKIKLKTALRLFNAEPAKGSWLLGGQEEVNWGFRNRGFKDYNLDGWSQRIDEEKQSGPLWHTRAFTDSATGLSSQRVGFRKHQIPTEQRQKALYGQVQQRLDKIIDEAQCAYIETMASSLQGGDSEVVLSTAISKGEFVPEQYDKRLPNWQGLDQHDFRSSVLDKLLPKKDEYSLYVSKLAKLLPERQGEAQSLDDALAVLADSHGVKPDLLIYYVDEEFVERAVNKLLLVAGNRQRYV